MQHVQAGETHPHITGKNGAEMRKAICLAILATILNPVAAYGGVAPRMAELGSAEFASYEPVAPGSLAQRTLVYTVGESGSSQHGSIQIRVPFTLARFEFSVPQTSSPELECYISTKCSNDGTKLDVEIGSLTMFVEGRPANKDDPPVIEGGNASVSDLEFIRMMTRVKEPGPIVAWAGKYYPIVISVAEGELSQGDTISVALGEGKGFRAPTLATPYLRFRVFVDPDGDGRYDGELTRTPTLRVRRPDSRRFEITAPLQVERGKPFEAHIVALTPYACLDVNRGIDRSFDGELAVWLNEERDEARSVELVAARKGSVRVPGLVLPEPGLYRLHVRDSSTGLGGTSHRIECVEGSVAPVYWGDLHVHTALSYDGWEQASPEGAYPWAREVANLDFAAITDHTERNLGEKEFEIVKRLAREHNRPGEFVTFPAYEWSGQERMGGDHNVFFIDDDPPLYRHVDEPTRHLVDLMEKLKSHKAFVIPHFVGRRANWDIPVDNEAAEIARRVVEIYSVHQSSEFGDGLANDGLKKWKLGFIGSGDGHEAHPGDTYNVLTEMGLHGGLAAVRASELTRRGIAQAIHSRNCYATSGERQYVEFWADDHRMGTSFASTTSPVFKVKAFGTANVWKVDLIKDGEIIATKETNQPMAETDFTDGGFDEKPSYYYVRVTFADGERAWASPVWVN